MATAKSEERKKRRESLEKEGNYISPKQFTEDIRAFYDASDELDLLDPNDESIEAFRMRRKYKKALDVCGVSLFKMIKGLSKNGKFYGYTWKESMISDALIKCTKALIGKKYNFSLKYNPFSYFNKIAYCEFITRIKAENKHVKTENEYIARHYDTFAKESDVPIYTRPLYNERVGSINLYDESLHTNSDDSE